MTSPTAPVALVTGSSSGIGAEVARRLAADGHTVVVHSRSSVEKGEAVAAEVGGTYLQADLADEGQAARLVERVLERHGRLDVLVNNAGTTEVVPHRDLAAAGPELWRRLYDVNVVAPFVLVTAAEQALRAAAPGCVVNVSSLAGVRPDRLVDPLRREQGRPQPHDAAAGQGARPGRPGQRGRPRARRHRLDRRLGRHQGRGARRSRPLRRSATPGDVAEVVMGLVRSTYVTGQVVVVDGGLGLVG